MAAQIQIRAEMLPYLVYQRPAYKGLEPKAAGKLVQAEIDKFIKVGAPWLGALPKRALRVLDIGAGLGFGTLAMAQHLGSDATFTILDKSRVEKEVFYGFEKDGAAYNELSLSRSFLVANGIDENRLTVLDVEKDGFPKGAFDVIISCISWGFHYPVSTYVEQVSKQLAPDGILYLDIRAGTDGQAVLEKAGFRPIHVGGGRKSIATAWKRA